MSCRIQVPSMFHWPSEAHWLLHGPRWLPHFQALHADRQQCPKAEEVMSPSHPVLRPSQKPLANFPSCLMVGQNSITYFCQYLARYLGCMHHDGLKWGPVRGLANRGMVHSTVLLARKKVGMSGWAGKESTSLLTAVCQQWSLWAQWPSSKNVIGVLGSCFT